MANRVTVSSIVMFYDNQEFTVVNSFLEFYILTGIPTFSGYEIV